MAALRRAHLAHFLIAASCSAVAPATSGTIEGVAAIEFIPCSSNQQCTNENVSGAALSPGAAWVTRFTSTGGNPSDNSVQLERLTFDGDAGATVVKSIPTAMLSDVAVTPDGANVYFLGVEQGGQVAMLRALSAAGADRAPIALPSNQGCGDVPGLLADPGAVTVGVGGSGGPSQGGNNDPDVSYWLQGTSSIPSDVRGGFVARVNVDDGGVGPTQPTTFVITYSHHLMAADATNVYWVAGPSPQGEVHMAPRDLSATESQLAVISSGAAPVGLAAANGKVAWSSTADLFGTTPGCWIWQSSVLVFQSTTSWCMGLAIDATDAYFATVEMRSFTDNSGQTQTFLAATGMARVSLAGPAQQTPHVLALTTDRIFGPRRILVDSQYVYGIDPAYVLRAPKSAFAP
ncbi:MAG TPA: hypothetical protein VLM85_08270 [Polyangiaceae bacterium]|nr:hypothetical protein [Polyangiaceae bacterium]